MRDADCMRDLCQYTTVDGTHWKCNAVCGLHEGIMCQVRVYSGRGSGQVRTKVDEGREQRAGQGISPAGVGDRLDSTTKDNER